MINFRTQFVLNPSFVLWIKQIQFRLPYTINRRTQDSDSDVRTTFSHMLLACLWVIHYISNVYSSELFRIMTINGSTSITFHISRSHHRITRYLSTLYLAEHSTNFTETITSGVSHCEVLNNSVLAGNPGYPELKTFPMYFIVTRWSSLKGLGTETPFIFFICFPPDAGGTLSSVVAMF